MRISLPIWSTNHTFLAFFVRFVARHKRMGSIGVQTCSRPRLHEREGPGARAKRGEREGRSERSERRVWTPMLPAARVANGVAARGAESGGGQVINSQLFTESSTRINCGRRFCKYQKIMQLTSTSRGEPYRDGRMEKWRILCIFTHNYTKTYGRRKDYLLNEPGEQGAPPQ